VQKFIVGSEALASGTLTRQTLRAHYDKVHQNVYAPKGLELDARDKAHAAWLWSRRDAVLVGSSAAAMLGTKWLPDDAPPELARSQFRSPKGIVTHSGAIADDEIRRLRGIPCTTPARTAYDIGRRIRKDESIIRIDALLNATRIPVSAVEAIADRYPGARGVRGLRTALDLVDGGAESPQETRLRLVLVRSIEPRPVTQIPVRDDRGRVRRRIDMGYPEWMVGVEYDGEQHFEDAEAYANDIMRLEFLANRGWTIVRVSACQLREERREVVERVRRALVANGMR
jgi:very-short-patch-repair endonuclease